MKLKTIDVTKDFKKLYPEAGVYFPHLSSNQLWALALYVLPSSPYSNLHYKDKRPAISELFNKDLDWESLSELAESFANAVLSKEYRFLMIWEKELEDRFDFIRSIDYREANEELINLKEKMLASTNKLWEYYEKCKKNVEKSSGENLEGDSMESLSESGVI